MVQAISEKISEMDTLTVPTVNTIIPVTEGSLSYKLSVGDLEKRILDYIDPANYGAVGTGLVDDRAALLLAITAGVAAGKPVSGMGKTYGISGDLSLISSAWVQDLTLKQLTPADSARTTLYSEGASNLRLIRVKVNRNGTGSSGDLNYACGIYIGRDGNGGSGHLFEDVEVYGDDTGTGFRIRGASDFDCVRLYAHDIKYLLAASPGDDRVQGFWFQDCTDFRVIAPRVRNLGGNFGSGFTTQYSRNPFGGCENFSLIDAQVSDVDQGIDLTGSDGNNNFRIVGGCVRRAYTWGWKFANSAEDGIITSAEAINCGAAGFVVSGPSASAAAMSADLTFIGCSAYDTGSNGRTVDGMSVGFRVVDGTTTAAGSTRGMRFVDCKAHDRQGVPTMTHGFFNNTAANTDGRYNEAVDCVSLGHTVAAFSGMNQARAELTRTPVAVPTAAWTIVDWDGETDLGALYPGSGGQIYARRAGEYQIDVGVVFDANATGQRGVRLTGAGGVPIAGPLVLVDAAASGLTCLNLSWLKTMVIGDEIRVEVWQSSGGSLGLGSTNRAIVRQVG